MVRISVVIPTYNRSQVLSECIQSLLHQSVARDEYEILVVNDGSEDGTKQFMSKAASKDKNTFYFEQSHKGPAAARNLGVRHARGRYVLFIGDDIIASEDLLNSHLNILESQEDTAVLGLTLWDKSINVTKFMNFINNTGYQFNYGKLTHGQLCHWDVFYTSNISLSKRWFDSELFDANFPYPAWEDIELGYRLHQKGLRTIFNKYAIAFHKHEISEAEFYNKIHKGGKSRVYFYKKHPELKNISCSMLKTKLILFILKGIKIYSATLKFFTLDDLAWELHMCYYTNLGIYESLKKNT